jgi:hypothetical protein
MILCHVGRAPTFELRAQCGPIEQNVDDRVKKRRVKGKVAGSCCTAIGRSAAILCTLSVRCPHKRHIQARGWALKNAFIMNAGSTLV